MINRKYFYVRRNSDRFRKIILLNKFAVIIDFGLRIIDIRYTGIAY